MSSRHTYTCCEAKPMQPRNVVGGRYRWPTSVDSHFIPHLLIFWQAAWRSSTGKEKKESRLSNGGSLPGGVLVQQIPSPGSLENSVRDCGRWGIGTRRWISCVMRSAKPRNPANFNSRGNFTESE